MGMSEQDTREQLEADVREWIDIATYKTFKPERMLEVMLHWLNRQAAITAREYWHNCCQNHVDYDEEYKPAIDELTAERDKLQAAIDAMENGQFYAMYKAKCEECEQLKKVARTQAESFKKLECELAGKDG